MPTMHKNEDDIETVIRMTNNHGKNIEDKKNKIIENANKKNKRKEKRTKKIIKWVSIIALVIIGIIFTFTSPIFDIVEIEVENNNILTKEKVVSLSGISKNQNIFRFLKSDVETHLKEDPYIESATIERKLPNVVSISIKERQRDFSLKFLNGYAYINNQGYILEIAEDSLDLPILVGAETPEEDIKVGKRLVSNDLKKLEVAIQIMALAKENEINSKITSIDISDKNEYILYLAEEKKTVYLGNETYLRDKFWRIKAIMANEKDKEGTIYVNVDFSKQPARAYFREKV